MATSRRIGIVVSPTDQYCRQIVTGIVSWGSHCNWEYVVVPGASFAAFNLFGRGSIDGCIAYVLDEPSLFKTGVPVVNVCSPAAISRYGSVSTDQIAVGRLAATYLLSLGLPRFGFLGQAGRPESLLRQRGFEETLKAAGEGCLSCLVKGPADADASSVTLLDWAEGLPRRIGILASSDALGMHFLAGCRKLKLTVPQDTAVIGVGNDELICSMSNPPMTSIALAGQRVGLDAAMMLETMMDDKKLSEKTVLVPPVAVIPRPSTSLMPVLDQDVAAALRYISLHAKDGLRVADILKNIPVSRSSLDQRFVKALGRSPAIEIRRAQVELAKRLLADTHEQMPQVALAAGFLSAKQLAATFQREIGVTPTAYRRQHQVLSN